MSEYGLPLWLWFFLGMGGAIAIIALFWWWVAELSGMPQELAAMRAEIEARKRREAQR